jgi:hypothetical protein
MAQTTGVINGGIIGIYNGANKIAVATGCNFSLSHAPRDTSNKDDGQWTAKGTGRTSAQCGGSGLFKFDTNYNYSYLWGLIAARTALTIKVGNAVVGDLYYSFTGYLTSLECDFPDQESSTYSYTVEATGAVTEATN